MILGFDHESEKFFNIDEDKAFVITLEFTKPKKRGRPSKKDKELYGIKHIILPDSNSFEDCKEAINKYIEKHDLPVKVNSVMNKLEDE